MGANWPAERFFEEIRMCANGCVRPLGMCATSPANVRIVGSAPFRETYAQGFAHMCVEGGIGIEKVIELQSSQRRGRRGTPPQQKAYIGRQQGRTLQMMQRVGTALIKFGRFRVAAWGPPYVGIGRGEKVNARVFGGCPVHGAGQRGRGEAEIRFWLQRAAPWYGPGRRRRPLSVRGRSV
jgi:hypothetical protein